MHKIWTARKNYEEKKAGKEEFSTQREDKNRQIGLIPVPDLNPIMVDMGSVQQDDIDGLKYEAQLQEIHRRIPEKAQLCPGRNTCESFHEVCWTFHREWLCI